MGTSLSTGGTSPFPGVNPQGNDWDPLRGCCQRTNIFGVPVFTNCQQMSQCQCMGTCSGASQSAQPSNLPMQPQPQGQVGIDNNLVMVIVGGLVLVVIVLLIWRK